MPLVHIFLPDDPAADQLARAQELARGVDSGGASRMPGLVQRETTTRGLVGEKRDLPSGGGGWLLEHHVLARAQRHQGRVEMRPRWGADGNAVQVRDRGEHALEIGKARTPLTVVLRLAQAASS